MNRIVAIVREVPDAIADCELSFVERAPIDLERAREQHAAYVAALEATGCEVRVAPSLPEMADAVFVEDTAIAVDELAVLARPGAESRRGEVASMADALRPLRPLAWIEAPGTLDGGDVLRIGRQVHVGRSARSNDSGLARKRVPITAPCAPNISAAAKPRPSMIPPAASTGTGATASTTAGTRGRVARVAPCPPASLPCATIRSAPAATASSAAGTSCTWQISNAPAAFTWLA